jgi:lactate dehydrogenase-like 2-hydroxyacid dehydrogenase
MPKPVLLVTRRLPPAIEAMAARDFVASLTASDIAITDLLERAQGADAILCCPGDVLDAKAIAALPESVKVIGTFSVGYDHIDIAAATGCGIKVCNTPDVLSVATAECAMLLILAAARRAGEGERLVRSGTWAGWAPTQLMGTGVSGRKLGIFGLGRIANWPGWHAASRWKSTTATWSGCRRSWSKARCSTTATTASCLTAKFCPCTRPAAAARGTGWTRSASRNCRPAPW